jgi:hypothetical protein
VYASSYCHTHNLSALPILGHCTVRWEEVEVGTVKCGQLLRKRVHAQGKQRKVRTAEAARMWRTATETTAGLAIFSLSTREVDTSGTIEGRLLFFLCALVTFARLDDTGVVWKHRDRADGTLLRAHADGEDTRTGTDRMAEEGALRNACS